MTENISKNEMLAFLGFLQHKTIIIDSQIIHYRTFFNRYTKDLREEALEIAKIVTESTSPIEAYKRLAHRKAKNNCLWKTVPEFGFMFAEDIYDYLEEKFGHNGKEVLDDIVSGKYEKGKYKEPFSAELTAWARVGVVPARRGDILNYFPTEYMNFCYENYECKDNPYLVQKISNKGAYNGYGWEAHKVRMATEPNKLCISYDSAKNPIPETDVINAAKMLISALDLDRVNIHDFSTEYTVVVRNQKKINEENR